MKKLMFVFMLLIIVPCFIMAQDDEVVEEVAEVAVTEEVVEEATVVETVDKSPSIGQGVWNFINTPIGISIVGSILLFALGKLFTKKPKWKALALKYGPSLMQAVKTAEKNVKDGSKLDQALKYVIELEPKLSGIAEEDVKRALTAVHTTAESNGNLKKE